MDAVICCIAKLEGPYILEWVTYHLKLGFSKIYIFDNNNDKTRLRSYFTNRDYVSQQIANKVVLIHFPGNPAQLEAYEKFRINYSYKHTWVAILDCDEFIVLKKWEPITIFLSKFCKQGTLSLNWRLFGDSGRTNYSSEPVTQRFTLCESKLNCHVKSISVCKDIKYLNHPHMPELKNGYQHDVNGTKINGPFNNNNESLNIAYINHYFGKTREEWQIKKDRGKATGEMKRTDCEFDAHNFNEVEDLSAHNFYTDSSLNFFTSP